MEVSAFHTAFLAIFCIVPVLSQRSCKINDFDVQRNFRPERFSGVWHLVGYNRMLSPVTRLPPRIKSISTRYVKSRYYLGADGRGFIMSNGQVTVTLQNGYQFTRCERVDFSTIMEEGSRPVMDLIQVTGRRRGSITRSHIMETDYNNYAVRYTCEEELNNGRCAPDKDHLWVLRKDNATFALTPTQIQNIMSRLCISGSYVQSPIGEECPVPTMSI
ncbi:retinol-binding protein 4-like [Saccostrea echinata]|uniref:retinol-binding protein 4-like n=1 Tax=Saccostrea echinata TaxID=191078 RepID=UPI002A806CE4|nr:retinol-binding protein 4-like [Saccostrea echinata]